VAWCHFNNSETGVPTILLRPLKKAKNELEILSDSELIRTAK
jgi:hypothetical protein